MILELAILNVRRGQAAEFEQAFGKARRIISSMPGYVSHELQRCLEVPDKYVLLVRWRRLEDHTEGFRKSAEYGEWRPAPPFLRPVSHRRALRVCRAEGRLTAQRAREGAAKTSADY